VYYLAMAPRGVYRERDGWGNQHSVFVDYGTQQMDISEEKYKEDGYQPPFDELPWREAAPKDRYIQDIEERLAQIKSDLEPLESSQIRINSRRAGEDWIDTTEAMIESHKRNIAIYEAILARHRKEGGD